MKKKAAIFTWCYDNGPINYGQILQCYATQELCREYGLDVTVIKYRHLKEFEKAGNIPPKGRERNQYERLYKDKYVEKQNAGQVKKFLNFISDHIRLSPQCYSIEDIEEEISDKDILIVGSDQLWNPLWFDPVYLLGFAKKNQRRVSIATGGISIDKEIYRPVFRQIANSIEKFDYVSVREAASKKILASYTDKRIVDILDPTLLLNEISWKSLCCERLVKEKYIFVYCLGRLTPHKHILKEISRKFDIYRVIYIKKHDSDERINNEDIMKPIADVGPEEFLSLIKYSDLVCTDSFHGFAFSLIFRKDFYLMDRAYIDNNEISRIREKNVMDKFKIKKRYANSKKDLSQAEKVDYINVGRYLCEKRHNCKKDIEQAIVYH